MEKPERIAKVIARAGICSRRDAEKMIEDGKVELNGVILEKPGVTVVSSDIIKVDGKPISTKEKTRIWLLNKPKNTITSNKDPEGRQTVFDILPNDMPRVISVGRLDYTTEGLLILTNDGELARKLEHPSTGWVRKYKVRAYGDLDKAKLDRIRKGATIDDVKYKPAQVDIERQQNKNTWMTVSITEGKNREVRKMLEYAGLLVNRLIRTSYGPLQLGNLKEGEVKEVPEKIIKEQINFKN